MSVSIANLPISGTDVDRFALDLHAYAFQDATLPADFVVPDASVVAGALIQMRMAPALKLFMEKHPTIDALQFKDSMVDARNTNQGKITEILPLLDALSQRRIPFIVFKGLALSEELYGDVALRYLGDVDLLIEPHRVSEFHEVASALGFRQKIDPKYSVHGTEVERPAFPLRRPRFTTLYSYVNPLLSVSVEAHHDIAYVAAESFYKIFEAAIPFEVEGVSCLKPGAVDHLIIHCLDKIKDFESVSQFGLSDLFDIATAAKRIEGVLEVFCKRASELGVSKACADTLFAALRSAKLQHLLDKLRGFGLVDEDKYQFVTPETAVKVCRGDSNGSVKAIAMASRFSKNQAVDLPTDLRFSPKISGLDLTISKSHDGIRLNLKYSKSALNYLGNHIFLFTIEFEQNGEATLHRLKIVVAENSISWPTAWYSEQGVICLSLESLCKQAFADGVASKSIDFGLPCHWLHAEVRGSLQREYFRYQVDAVGPDWLSYDVSATRQTILRPTQTPPCT